MYAWPFIPKHAFIFQWMYEYRMMLLKYFTCDLRSTVVPMMRYVEENSFGFFLKNSFGLTFKKKKNETW